MTQSTDTARAALALRRPALLVRAARICARDLGSPRHCAPLAPLLEVEADLERARVHRLPFYTHRRHVAALAEIIRHSRGVANLSDRRS